MAKFNIKADSVKMAGDKTAMEVTFKADDGRSVTCYHEVESLDKDTIMQELQNAADEFEKREAKQKEIPPLETGKDLSVTPKG